MNPIPVLAACRFGFAASCLLHPGTAARVIGERPEEITPAAESFAALTATRAAALGVLEVSAPRVPAQLRKGMFGMIAAVDGVDVVTCLVRFRRTKRIAPVLAGVPIGLLSVYLHLRAAAGSR